MGPAPTPGGLPSPSSELSRPCALGPAPPSSPPRRPPGAQPLPAPWQARWASPTRHKLGGGLSLVRPLYPEQQALAW